MGALSALTKKELKDILRERSLVLALVAQFFVAAFSAFLTIGLVTLYDPHALEQQQQTQVAYVGPGGFLPLLAEAPGITARATTYGQAIEAYRNGQVSAIV